MGRPPIDRRPNALLAQWQDRAGLSNVELARAVTAASAARGRRDICPDESSVRRWKAGEMPRPPVPVLITAVLSERTMVTLTCADIGMPGPAGPPTDPLALPWRPASTLDALAHLTRSELMLPHTRTTADAKGVDAGERLLSPLQQWANARPTFHRPRHLDDGTRIGMTDVEALRSVTAAFRDVDNRHGGALSRKAVLAQINDAVAMLDTSTYSEAVGQQLFSAVADLGSVAAWMTFDAGHHRTAQGIFITALHAAAEGGDRRIGAHILQCMARQMSHLERYDDALDLVALAQYGARRDLSPATTSMLHALEARFHAILGNLDDSETSAGRAEDAFTRIDPADEPPYMAFFDEAELSATVGVAHQIAAKASTGPDRTRRAEKSLLLISHATGLRPEHRVRSKAFDHLGMARTHLTVGDLDGAHGETQRALHLFGTISSRRVADRLTELHDEAEPFATSPLGSDLRQSIASAVS